uniref:Aminotransferase-like plant mobile domain-containing protein n=1 Tax=Chenopodium quinoa TaxID=63459 RepID=A0A803LAN3_CHEQI
MDLLNQCVESGGLYSVLTLPESNLLSPFLKEVMEYNVVGTNTFQINGHTLGITLEDVLFLTRLKIDGDPVLIKNYSDVHSISILRDVISDISELRTIALATDRDDNCRLLRDAIRYAWGAAILAHLQYHLERFHQTGKLYGCSWLLVCFFLIRIPKLWDSLRIEDARQELEAGALDQHPFPMAWIMTKLHSNNAIFNDHRGGYRRRMHFAFQDLKDEHFFSLSS